MRSDQTYKLLYSKGNREQNKRQPTEWDKIFANDATDKGLIFKYTNNSYNSTAATKITIKKKKGSEDLDRHLSKEEMHMGQ